MFVNRAMEPMKTDAKQEIGTVGVVGLGLTGRGIAACLLANGFAVTACDRAPRRRADARAHIKSVLDELQRRGLPAGAAADGWQARFQTVRDPAEMGACGFAIEAVDENLRLKQQVFGRLEAALDAAAVIASNTSSIPITLLQRGRAHPERIIGMHWGEPAEIMRYLEIIPGVHTSAQTVRRTRRLGELCGKRPTVLQRDIRGFISNRLMYAMMREAFYLLESGVADLETIDDSFRNDIGWWAGLAGPFRWMDLTGIPAYAAVMKGLFPKLANSRSVPRAMREMVRGGARGISNRRGFYRYTRAGAAEWQRAWTDFTYEMRSLVEKYEGRLHC
jgi:3-hydroxybutyryl-CoA dehydrogenase